MGAGVWLVTLVAVVGLHYSTAKAPPVLKASQCFKSRGIPKVEFECPPNNMVKIRRAFHGISTNSRQHIEAEPCEPSPGHKSHNCTYCPGDCVDDSMNMVYDWSTCMGNTSCLRTVMQSYMPSCPSKQDKFSDYLQVEYQCIPRSSVIDICSNSQQWPSEGYIMSPNYPNHYPTKQDCLCKIQTDWNSRIVLSFYDLLLETKKGRCRADWLMLRQGKQKHRHCGAIMTGTKNVTSESNSLTLQFHSDGNDNHTQNFQYFTRNLKGFWLYFRAEPDSGMQITCRRLTSADPEVKEIHQDDADFLEVVSTKDSMVPPGEGGEPRTIGTDAEGEKRELPTDANTVMGDDVPKRAGGAGGTRRKGKKGKSSAEAERANEVEKQAGSGQSRTQGAVLVSLLSSILLAIFRP